MPTIAQAGANAGDVLNPCKTTVNSIKGEAAGALRFVISFYCRHGKGGKQGKMVMENIRRRMMFYLGNDCSGC